MSELLDKVRRGLKKPPKVIAKRAVQEFASYSERYLGPRRARKLTLSRLLKNTGQQNIDQLWMYLARRPYCALANWVNESNFEALCPGDTSIIFTRAKRAMAHHVDLLGSGLVDLGRSIDWHRDYKSQFDWPLHYIRDINYNNPERSSDVKFPWEVSRLQWLIPVGQAYLITRDECYAQAAKDVFLDWIKKNPYSYGVNWSCTMEVALRILSWTWFFHVFHTSRAWQQDTLFQQQFLICLYLHGDFTQRHLEQSDINGNHYTADAAGLVFAGLFFGKGNTSEGWLKKGWVILCDELPRQVYADGVDFEASIPYHRLVLELFFLPARYRELHGLETPAAYSERLCLMAEFSASYSQPGGTVPLWGDADDARALPFGTQDINDHRYLCGLIGYAWNNMSLLAQSSGSLSESFWLFGESATQTIRQYTQKKQLKSSAFPLGGFYIMRNKSDHVFIDCGPLGLAGRGGHGHNDCLAFEAVLNGEKLISDCGAYVYTASYQERNLFRSTHSHNTPCIDEQEINRFIRWDYLWNMHNDAQSIVEAWEPGNVFDYFRGTHSGYERLTDPVTPKRTIILNHEQHSLLIQDDILCKGCHEVCIPLHLALGVTAIISDLDRNVVIRSGQREFILDWKGTADWQLHLAAARVSPTYGVAYASEALLWKASIAGDSQLKMVIKGTI